MNMITVVIFFLKIFLAKYTFLQGMKIYNVVIFCYNGYLTVD